MTSDQHTQPVSSALPVPARPDPAYVQGFARCAQAMLRAIKRGEKLEVLEHFVEDVERVAREAQR